MMPHGAAQAEGGHRVAGRLLRLPHVAAGHRRALFELIEKVEFDRSPLTDIKQIGHCDIGLVEGGLCNAENVHVLREFRAHCKTLVAVGACAINGGLPAQRNHLDLGDADRRLPQRPAWRPAARCPTTPNCRCR
jgi:NAD-reducing hydrogenase small subunit